MENVMTKRIIIVFLLAGFWASRCFASVDVFLDKSEGTLSDTFQLTVQVEGEKLERDPVPPQINGLSVQSSGKSQQVQIINGQMSKRTQYLFQLVPDQPGVFLIPEIEVQTENGVIKTKPLQLSVVKDESAAPASVKGKPGVTANELVFLEAETSAKEAFVGELIVYRLKFYRRLPTTAANLAKPSFKGFSVEDLEGQKDYEKVVSGKHFDVSEIQFALFPLEAGSVTIDPAKVNFEMVDYDPSDPFSRFGFFSQGKRRRGTAQSEALTLQIKPLPEAGRPKDFTGLIGQFQLESDIPKEKVSVGESLTLTFTLKGTGNVRQMPDIKSEDNADLEREFKIYDDKPKLNIRVTTQGIFGEKIFKKALVPRVPGVLKIPAFAVSYFDSHKMQYVTLRSPESQVEVIGGGEVRDSQGLVAGANPFSKRNIQVTGEDLMPVMKTHGGFHGIQWSGREKIIFSALAITPAFLFLGALSLQRRRQYSLLNQGVIESKNALKIAKRQAEELRKNFSWNDLSLVVAHFIGRKFQVKGSALTSKEMVDLLRERNVKESTVRNLQKVMDHIEAAKFMGRSKGAEDGGLVTEVIKILETLDQKS